VIFASRPTDPGTQAWLRADIAGMLDALAMGRHPGDDWTDGYLAALATVATALGIRVQLPPMPEPLSVVVEDAR